MNPKTAEPTYVPDDAARASLLGELRNRTFTVPAPYAGTTSANVLPFRTSVSEMPALLDNLYAKPAPPDQITCVLRTVGTFGSPGGPEFLGVTPPGAPEVHEVRRILDMDVYADKLATGATGFNIPSLLGVAAGAPYFHAGNARTLEELFDPTFVGHHLALGTPTPDEVAALVDFLLSIDDDSEPLPVPIVDGYSSDLCALFGADR